MTTEAQRLADELREALTIGREAAYEVAQTYHASMAGYRLYEHDRLDADVKKIDAAIDRLASMIPAGGLAEEARDSKRYQWLRSLTMGCRDDRGAARFRLPNIEAIGDIMKGSVAQHLDAAIDAAMASSTPPQEAK